MLRSTHEVSDSNDFLLDGVAFYGRTLNEYVEMFDFRLEDWKGKAVLDCASGPASFTAESQHMGIRAVACDPMYEHDLPSLVARAELDVRLCLQKPRDLCHLFEPVTSDASSHYVSEKQRAIFNFSRDFSQGKTEGRYVAGSLPHLPFDDNCFDLVLCAHLLFVYASKDNGGMFNDERFPLSFHVDAVIELLRVSRNEVRIYPLKGPNRDDNPMLENLLQELKNVLADHETVNVDYKDIRGANTMLRIRKHK